MIVIPVCLSCENVQKGMICPKYPHGIPQEILLAWRKGNVCIDYKEKITNTTCQ
jgi:hypothetical protein